MRGPAPEGSAPSRPALPRHFRFLFLRTAVAGAARLFPQIRDPSSGRSPSPDLASHLSRTGLSRSLALPLNLRGTSQHPPFRTWRLSGAPTAFGRRFLQASPLGYSGLALTHQSPPPGVSAPISGRSVSSTLEPNTSTLSRASPGTPGDCCLHRPAPLVPAPLDSHLRLPRCLSLSLMLAWGSQEAAG